MDLPERWGHWHPHLWEEIVAVTPEPQSQAPCLIFTCSTWHLTCSGLQHRDVWFQSRA
ncbi:rCG37084 [Rattus norvegicus]|uniref:RCG37084 n=1 Tax=Rattus norvegicus TaxID=10116 RepID=A6HU27_RAT|nr:rCG37084 [Rattus norvegicus]